MTLRLPREIRDRTRPYVAPVPVPILSGPNRGRWWSLASAGSGYATGRWEPARMQLIERLIRPDDCVWDVGAHHGYVTLLVARRVRSPQQVHAFEPSPQNHRMLLRHLRWNHLERVRVHQLALSDFVGVASFGGSGSSKTFALDRGTERVEVRSGGWIVASEVAPAPTFLKIDVEGAEAGVLRGLIDVLPPAARLLISMHSPEAVEQTRALLAPRGFRLLGTTGLHRALATSFGSDPDLLALGPACGALSAETIGIGGLVDVRD